MINIVDVLRQDIQQKATRISNKILLIINENTDIEKFPLTLEMGKDKLIPDNNRILDAIIEILDGYSIEMYVNEADFIMLDIKLESEVIKPKTPNDFFSTVEETAAIRKHSMAGILITAFKYVEAQILKEAKLGEAEVKIGVAKEPIKRSAFILKRLVTLLSDRGYKLLIDGAPLTTKVNWEKAEILTINWGM